MKTLKIRGIVIGEASMGDKDKRLTVLTRELGKIAVLAKGAKGQAAKSASSAQLFCCSQFVLEKGRTFYYIKEAEILDSFYELRTRFDALSYASLMVEAARELSLDGEDNTALMDLLLRGLTLCKREETHCRLISLIFLMRLVCDSGFRPDLNRCTVCGALYDGSKGWLFSASRGGLVCPSCARDAEDAIRPGTLSALRYIADAPLKEVYRFTVTEEIENDLARRIRQYVTIHTGIRLHSLEFIQNMENLM